MTPPSINRAASLQEILQLMDSVKYEELCIFWTRSVIGHEGANVVVGLVMYTPGHKFVST